MPNKIHSQCDGNENKNDCHKRDDGEGAEEGYRNEKILKTRLYST